MYPKLISHAKINIAMADVPGPSIKNRLQKSDPFKESKCRDPTKCVVRGGDGKYGNCRSEGAK